MVDSAITCDEITDVEAKSNNEEAKTFPTNFNDNSTIIFDKVIDSYDEEIKTIQQILIKQVNSKTQSFYILLVFLLIIIVLFIAASIYCCLIKYHAKNLF